MTVLVVICLSCRAVGNPLAPQQPTNSQPQDIISWQHPAGEIGKDHIHRGPIRIVVEAKGNFRLYLFHYPNMDDRPIRAASPELAKKVYLNYIASAAQNVVYITHWLKKSDAMYSTLYMRDANNKPILDENGNPKYAPALAPLGRNQELYELIAAADTNTPVAMSRNDLAEKKVIKAEEFILVTQKLDNGIAVGQAKLFDDRTLMMMLQSLQDSLAQTTFPNPTGLFPFLNQFQGASALQTSQSLSITGQPTPNISTTLGSGTTALTQNQSTAGTQNSGTQSLGTQDSTGNMANTSNGQPSTGQTTITTTTTTASGSQTTTNTTNSANTSTGATSSFSQTINQPGVTPTAPTLPGQISPFNFQPPFGLNAQNLLSDQVALTYQILNLRLLLDRSLSDRLIRQDLSKPSQPSETQTYPERLQAVIGFSISIDSLAKYRGAVAEVVITVQGDNEETTQTTDRDHAVSLVALFPQNKTYNVARIRQNASNLGFGAVVNVLNLGLANGRASQTLYLARDTDTVAVEREPLDEASAQHPHSVQFAWQFRPVLDQRAVEPGSRQVFAMISIPRDISKGWTAHLTALTRWRRYDKSTGAIGEVIRGSESAQQLLDLPVPRPADVDNSLTPVVKAVQWQDMGQGVIQVIATGDHFLPGTSVSVAGLPGAAPAATIDGETQMRFLMPAQQLALRSVPMLIGRYGSAPLQQGSAMTSIYSGLSQCSANAELINADLAKVALTVNYNSSIPSKPAGKCDVTNKNSPPFIPFNFPVSRHPIAVIGNQLFGLGDTPVATSGSGETVTLTFVAATKLLRTTPSVRIIDPFWPVDNFTQDVELHIPDDFTANAIDISSVKDSGISLITITGDGFDHPVVYIGGIVVKKSVPDFSPWPPPVLLPAQAPLPHAPGAPRKPKLAIAPLVPTEMVVSKHIILLRTATANLAGIKKIIVTQGAAEPVLLSLNQPQESAEPKVIVVSGDPNYAADIGRLAQGVGKTTIVGMNYHQLIKLQGSNFDAIKEIHFDDSKPALPIQTDKDPTILYVDPSLFDSSAGTYNLRFILKDGTTHGGSLDKNILTVVVKRPAG